jgi:hypothetical protein
LSTQILDKPLVVLGNLSGPDGNIFVIMGRCEKAWRDFHRESGTLYSGHEEAGEGPDGMQRFHEIIEEMKSGDYQQALAIVDREFVVLQPIERYERVSLASRLDEDGFSEDED